MPDATSPTQLAQPCPALPTLPAPGPSAPQAQWVILLSSLSVPKNAPRACAPHPVSTPPPVPQHHPHTPFPHVACRPPSCPSSCSPILCSFSDKIPQKPPHLYLQSPFSVLTSPQDPPLRVVTQLLPKNCSSPNAAHTLPTTRPERLILAPPHAVLPAWPPLLYSLCWSHIHFLT